MSRKNQNIKQYEKEIFELKEQGLTYKQIGERFGIERIKIKKFFERHRVRQRKLEAGIALKKRGRPPRDYIVREEDKIAELKYIIARKEAKIKSLEMQNELMRDFLSLTERK
ncbi:MAG: hypothetical protein IIX36_08885 [Clostridia bacterium]|nr:hypothetical protein [Clostridia bacterium]